MSILKIVTHPDSSLRQVAKEVAPEAIATMSRTFQDMAETMLVKDGVGLAAPQIGLSLRIIVISTKQGPLTMINPVITKTSLGKEWDEEGCLSVPHTFGKVKRYKNIHCDFLDAEGNQRRIAAKGFMARIIQHEIDHLDGILFIDKAKDIVSDTYTF